MFWFVLIVVVIYAVHRAEVNMNLNRRNHGEKSTRHRSEDW